MSIQELLQQPDTDAGSRTAHRKTVGLCMSHSVVTVPPHYILLLKSVRSCGCAANTVCSLWPQVQVPHSRPPNKRFPRFALGLTGIPETPEDTLDQGVRMHGTHDAQVGNSERDSTDGSGLRVRMPAHATRAIRPPLDPSATSETGGSPWWAASAATQLPPAALMLPQTHPSAGEPLKPPSFERRAGGAHAPHIAPQGVLAAAATAAAQRRAHRANSTQLIPSTAGAACFAEVDQQPLAAPRLDLEAGGGDRGAGSGCSPRSTQHSSDDCSGPLPLLSSMARAPSTASPSSPRSPSFQGRSGCVADTMALHTLEESTEETAYPPGRAPHSAQTAQHALHGFSFAISANITETMDEDEEFSGMETPTFGQIPGPATTPRIDDCTGPWAVSAAGHSSTQATSTDIGLSATDVTFSERHVRALMKQLDSFTSQHLFLGRFEMLGQDQRRRGGVLRAVPWSHPDHSHTPPPALFSRCNNVVLHQRHTRATVVVDVPR